MEKIQYRDATFDDEDVVNELKETDWEALKLELNNAIWMHALAQTTLAQAEEAACRAISFLSRCDLKRKEVLG